MKGEMPGRGRSLRLAAMSISPEAFARQAPGYRSLAFYFGQLANDISIVRRLLLLAMPSETGLAGRPDFYGQYYHAQVFALLRILAGKTFEGWKALRIGVEGLQPTKALAPSIELLAPGRLAACTSYFKADNSLAKIRNRFAFHADPTQWAGRNVGEITAECGFECIVRDGANSLYITSELILFQRLMKHCGLQPTAVDFELLLLEVVRYSTFVVEIMDATVAIVIQKCEREAIPVSHDTREVDDAVSASGFTMPVFVAAEKAEIGIIE